MNTLNQPTETVAHVGSPAGFSTRLRDSIRLLSRVKYDDAKMVSIIRELVTAGHLPMEAFPRINNGYSRTILYREPAGFEVMVARWSRDAITPVHGHPWYSLVYLIQGSLSESLFKMGNGRLLEIEPKIYSTGEFSVDRGIEGAFDNAIHQMTACEDSLSLHIYSDDAIKGEIYSI
ncbi:MAG: hypothetical protein ABIK68_06795 [bacterium]